MRSARLYINVADAAEGTDLARSLGRRGVAAALVRANDRWQVAVSFPRADARSLLADIGLALAAASTQDRRV